MKPLRTVLSLLIVALAALAAYGWWFHFALGPAHGPGAEVAIISGDLCLACSVVLLPVARRRIMDEGMNPMVGGRRIEPGLHRTGMLDVEAITRLAEKAGFTMFVLPAVGVVDRASFFDAVRATLPLDPPLARSRSWDALSDSLWEGLYTYPARRIAIVWPNTRAMASLASSDFETAVGVLAQVASLLADRWATRDSPKEVSVLVE